MAGRLEGKVIIVLGASDERSMGAATARRCHQEGAKLVLAARRLDKVQAIADSMGAVAIGCDITDEQQLAALADAAISHYGKLTALLISLASKAHPRLLILAVNYCNRVAMFT